MIMSRRLRCGVIGCGNISKAYFSLAPLFSGFDMVAATDIDMAPAEARAGEFGVRAMAVDELLHTDEIDIVVNLTIPAAHYEITARALAAGKHVYSEKPFVLALEEGLEIKKLAAERALRVGSAPDTFLGGSHQLARKLVDSGRLGRITSGTCHVMNHGMEHWHPNPDFFFLPGGGPLLDLGPYYIANLIQLIGPVKSVSAVSAMPAGFRTVSAGPRAGEQIAVATPTTVHGLMTFENGAVVTLNASWDVWHHGHSPMELYGETGSLYVPDPNFFGGAVRYTEARALVDEAMEWPHPFGLANSSNMAGQAVANYRCAGLADMVHAILQDRPHRCSLDVALHAMDVMTGMLRSGKTGKFVSMTTTCARPAALGVQDAEALLAVTPVCR
jgi:predicted dehydrogenase